MSEKKPKSLTWTHLFLFLLLSLTVRAAIQSPPPSPPPQPYDPGVRGGAAGAGASLPGLTTKESKFFDSGLDAFIEKQTVKATETTELGLGPRFNLDSCGGCHAQPATGGTSPVTNPQFTTAATMAPGNTVPPFVLLNGPVREVRFKYADAPANTIRDGGVHDIFTISGRSDAVDSNNVHCSIAQPDFTTAALNDNMIFRIPTPLFGAGLIQSISDRTIVQNIKTPPILGISGHENREGNTGTVTRFGWKAQNKSLLIFSSEAYNVEQGVTNEGFQQERDETPGCVINPIPENQTNFDETQPQRLMGDVVNFANFMLFLAPPTPVLTYTNTYGQFVTSTSIANGSYLFGIPDLSNPTDKRVGCALCHTPSMQTAKTTSAALSQKTANLFSDLLVHHMGPGPAGLGDDIIQGAAGADEFRTAPLWGLGQRIHFLHDGRTSDLLTAIGAHQSTGSEAYGVINRFNALSAAEKQDILNFLRSL